MVDAMFLGCSKGVCKNKEKKSYGQPFYTIDIAVPYGLAGITDRMEGTGYYCGKLFVSEEEYNLAQKHKAGAFESMDLRYVRGGLVWLNLK